MCVRRGFDLTRDSEFRSLVTLPPASFPFMAIIFHGAAILHEKHLSSDGRDSHTTNQVKPFFPKVTHYLSWISRACLRHFRCSTGVPRLLWLIPFNICAKPRLVESRKRMRWRIPRFERVFRLATLCLILPCLPRPGSYFVLAA
jgi:hypothetical protein